jgi:hypothetical protein
LLAGGFETNVIHWWLPGPVRCMLTEKTKIDRYSKNESESDSSNISECLKEWTGSMQKPKMKDGKEAN